MEIYMLWDTFGQPTAARRGITRIRHLGYSKGDPAGQTTALFINSNCRFAFRCNGSEADIRISKPDFGIQKNLSLRFTPTFHLTHPNSLYGQGLHQAKTPPKANLPITEVVKEKRLPKIF
ncbi:hypothetical protein AVEN_87790-1 [Araneus ventricosus]|uniref:Uncharacterized protein n=1 Tax=Araneus ventricosus TaxID=182803 RepID=A0A4Y2BCE7_ARAVE|nr:hypothetical protein AVEN_87790-1 [Araneus ventricosus]